MNRTLFFIDTLSMWVGHAFAWCILVLTFATSYEVFVRYVLRDPTAWAFDVSYIMYGALFMMGGAYTLSRDGHVRGDVLYRLWPPRVQAAVEFVLYFVFFFPGVLALIYAGYDYAQESWGYREASINSPIGVPVYPVKTLIPIAAFFLLLQGIAQVIRCVMCMRQGKWPPRLHDVEETETMLLREHAHEGKMGAGQGSDREREAT
ncbi:MAG: TRAP transporter small permease subunit [Anaerolineales bacterium]